MKGLVGKCAAVAALALAPLAVPMVTPPVAHAARAAPAPVVESKHWTEYINPNVVQLPEPVSQAIDDKIMALGKEMRIVNAAAVELMQDSWAVEDVWLIVVWWLLMSKGRRKLFDLINDLKAKKDAGAAAAAEEEGDKPQFEGSTLDWLEGPMQAVLRGWILLYLWDNLTKMLEVPEALTGVGAALDVATYVAVFGVIVMMIVSKVAPWVLRTKFSITEVALQTVIARMLNILIFIGTALKVGFLFGVPPASIIGVGGVGGLTFGLAAKDVFSNLIGGTVLALLRPFNIGEEIFITPSNNFRGSSDPAVANYTVKNIGWYQTILVAKDTLPTIVPNSYFLGANVINVTRGTARVCIFNFRVLPQDRKKVRPMTKALKEFLFANRLVDSVNYPVRVHFMSVEADHIVVRVECHCFKKSLTEFFDDKESIMLDALDIAEKHTSGVAFPTEVHLRHTLADYPERGLGQP